MSGPALLACLRAACEGVARVGVAVSGGGDSVAALVLAVEALGPGRVAAVSVDHGLRPEAATEVAGVAELCARLGVTHAALRWDSGHRGNLMAAARDARLGLIAAWAKGRVNAVILAHTLDDQAETVLMRLARGSGVDGLAGMAARREALGMTWLRPFLDVSRAALRAELVARGIGWIEDPSNADPQYLRVRARQALGAVSAMGITAEGLAATAVRMRRAQEVLAEQAQAALEAMVREERGTLLIDRAALALPGETRARLVSHLLGHLSGAAHRPRLAEVERLIAAGQGTLAGCVLAPEGAGLRLWREARAARGGDPWDGRWQARGPGAGQIGALGEAGLLALSRQAAAGLHPHWRGTGLPRAALAGLPGIWHEGALIASPLTFWPQGWALYARPLAAIVTPGSLSH